MYNILYSTVQYLLQLEFICIKISEYDCLLHLTIAIKVVFLRFFFLRFLFLFFRRFELLFLIKFVLNKKKYNYVLFAVQKSLVLLFFPLVDKMEDSV